MKTKKNLSGTFFRSQNTETGKWESRCFEDIDSKQQIAIIKKANPEFALNLTLRLADALNELGDKLKIVRK